MAICLPPEHEILIEEIFEYKNNTKIHTTKQVDGIAKSITMFGFTQPILLNNEEEKVIVAGHGRYLASKKIGLKSVPCYFLTDLSEEQKNAYRIIDNKTNESEWDLHNLSVEIDQIQDVALQSLFLIKNEKTSGTTSEAQRDIIINDMRTIKFYLSEETHREVTEKMNMILKKKKLKNNTACLLSILNDANRNCT